MEPTLRTPIALARGVFRHRYDIASFSAVTTARADQEVLERLGFRELVSGKGGYVLNDFTTPTKLASLAAL